MTDQLVDGPADGVDGDSSAATGDGGGAPAPDPAEPGGRAAAGMVTGDDPSDETSATATGASTGSAFQRWRERRRNRVSKWDRPPDPKDWRYFVGTLGKVLIATGILMFGFVAYQLWGTGIETARAQAKLKGEFQEQVEAISGGEDPAIGLENWVKPVRDGSPGDASGDATGDAIDSDVGLTDVGENPLDSVPALGPPSDVVPGGVDLSEYAVEQNVPIVPGDSFALLEIPKIGVSKYIVPGVKLTDLKRGLGHYPDTPLPGQLGNASIAGHRTTYGAPFFDLDQLVPGDEIDVTMVTGDRFVYRVTGIEIVTASDYWVVTTRDPNVAELTLTTCHPKYTARDRLVVHSVLVPEKSSQVGVAEFYQSDDEAAEAIPGDDPTLVAEPIDPEIEAELADDAAADATSVDTDDELGTIVASPGESATVLGSGTADESADDASDQAASAADDDSTTSPGDSAPADATVGDTADDAVAGEAAADVLTPDEVDPDSAELDAFSQGWFDDRDAFPQIALWGVALTIISLLAYQVSKRTRHDSIGFLVGIAPFLFCLYFFFQNVNRLLPPGL